MALRPTVVVVEDDKDMAKMLEVTLSPQFDVIVCTEKAHAISRAKNYLAESGSPDAMVIDLIINGQGGLDLYNWMHEQGFSAPVIFLTGCHPNSPEYIAAAATGEQMYEKDNFSSDVLATYLSQMVFDEAG